MIDVCDNAVRINVAVFVAESGFNLSNATLIPGSRTAYHLKVWVFVIAVTIIFVY